MIEIYARLSGEASPASPPRRLPRYLESGTKPGGRAAAHLKNREIAPCSNIR